jgi:uncharacterized protein
MTIELTPNGVACNLDCPYCYQKPMRDAGNISIGYDMDKMIAGLKREGSAFSLFGGEALLMPLDELETIFRFGLESYGSNGIQTNGVMITDAHIDLFEKYKVHVGMSVDGPGELNDSRWAGTLPKTRAATAKSLAAIDALCARGIKPSLIITLYRGNAVGERLEQLVQWLEELEALGVRHVRLHLLEVENEEIRKTMALTEEENIACLFRFYEFQKTTEIRFDLFAEMAKLLLGNDDQSTCVWNACDPYTTAAVQGVDGQGNQSNCGRANKDGIDWLKANTPGYERQVVLYQTPQSDLGCKDCRFFFACKGQCPGTAEHGDWRNRSEHCAIWMALFARIESDLRGLGYHPVSRASWLPQLERVMVDEWEAGRYITIRNAITRVQGYPVQMAPCPEGKHGDHWDAPNGTQHTDGNIVIHGDKGVTEMHGDSDMEIIGA